MPESATDLDYISPDLPLPISGVSPLAKLQETCRNIGVDSTCRTRERSPPYRTHQGRLHTPKSSKEKSSKVSVHREKIEGNSQAEIFKPSTHPPLSPPGGAALQPPHSLHCQTADYISASKQQQAFYQKLLYQTELERLQMPLVQNINPLILPTSNYLPETAGLPSPTSSNPVSPTDFAKLAAYFYHKLQQTSPSIPESNLYNSTATTEALLNYRKLFADSNNFLSPVLPSLPTFPPPPPKPQLHECHWVTSEGYCGKKHFSFDDLMLHLRSHVSSSTESLPLLGIGELPTTPYAANVGAHQFCKSQSVDNSRHLGSFPHSIKYQPYSIPLASRQLSVPFLH